MRARWRLTDELAAAGLALQFLTRLPISSSAWYSERRSAASVRYYPLVGALVGAVAALAWLASDALFHDSLLAALMASCATILFTGAFHEDGLADTCDGIGGGVTREGSLQIMRDSRLGTYGAVGLTAVLAMKVVALVALSRAMPMGVLAMTLLAGHGLSRASSVLVVATSCYVRAEGIAKPVAKAVDGVSLAVVLVSAALMAGGLAYAGPASPDIGRLVGGLGGALIGHLSARVFFERKLGGYTGDCLGCVQQLSEFGLYLGVLAAV
ncbi:MAG: adenosylcobinamide-GDP ribazoletransferase [Pseudomonadota bacterium]